MSKKQEVLTPEKKAPDREILFQMNLESGLVDVMIGRMRFMQCKYEHTQSVRELFVSLKNLEVNGKV